MTGGAAHRAEPPPLFDCKGTAARYFLRSSDDGSLLVEIEAPNARAPGVSTRLEGWTEIRTGRVVGQQGGHQSHVRLYDGQRNIIFYEGLDGELAARPGRTYAGVVEVGPSGTEEPETLAECRASATNRALLDNVRTARDAAGKPAFPEEDEGSAFDGWF